MGETRVTDAGLVHLGQTDVTDEGLSRLKPLVRLKSLWLHDTRVSDAAIPALARLDGLENLYVYRTNLTIDGVRDLKRNAALDTPDEGPCHGFNGRPPTGERSGPLLGRAHVSANNSVAFPTAWSY
ncbi:MAG: hypothetical protein JO114_18440 [Planctomycetaceae bacterium]|nr:hypothetical protein [Planctomycetaceae bacterium]